MRLLFDANLSPKLVGLVAEEFPSSAHVFEFGIEHDDLAIYEFAVKGGYCIVTKDGDFENLVMLFSPRAKTIKLRLGNCRTEAVATLLLTYRVEIESFLDSEELWLKVLP